MRKNIIACAVALMAALPSKAQTISVGVVSPSADSEAYMDAPAAKTIVTKLQAVLTKNGVGADGSDFVIVPTVTVDEDEMIETGMVNLFKINGSLNLVLKQLSTGKSFGSVAIPIRGTGKRNKNTAVKSAVGSINVNDPNISRFLEQSKKNVIDYYNSNSSSIIGKARTATANGEYEKALAILSSFPEGMPNESEINAEINKTYKAYLDENCQAAIVQAKAALARKDYSRVEYIISTIDPKSSCYSEALAITKTINNEIRTAEAQARADQKRREDNAVALRKASINAARDVAKAYYQRTYPTYNIVFR